MNVEQIRMEPSEARRRLAAYRRQLKRRVDVEYAAVARGLEELAKGKALLLLPRVFAVCPYDENGRPRIAIARADRKEVRFQWAGTSSAPRLSFDASAEWHGNDRQNRERGLRLEVPVAQRHPNARESWRQGHAMVPMIPADVREAVGRFRAQDRYILWEVEQWAERSQTQPDRDPFLLRHLGGDAYSVEAAWDLTDLERAVMAGRALH